MGKMLEWVKKNLGLSVIIGILGLIIAFFSLQFLYDFGISVDPMVVNDVKQGSNALIKTEVDFGLLYNKEVSVRTEPVQGIDIRFEPNLITDKDNYISEGIISVSKDAPAGKHLISIVGTGSDGKQHNCTLELNVISTKGSISILSPIGASVYLDGMDKGKTPISLDNVEQGQHTVTLKLTGYKDWSQLINVEVGKTTPISPDFESMPPPPAEVNFIYPSDSATVQMKETLAGIAKNIPEGKHLWIAIYPQNAYKYYPQNPVNVQSDGSWTLPVQFGGEEHVGYKFDIYVILVDDNAQKELNKYIEGSEKSKSWDGIGVLPDGTTEIKRITVIRK